MIGGAGFFVTLVGLIDLLFMFYIVLTEILCICSVLMMRLGNCSSTITKNLKCLLSYTFLSTKLLHEYGFNLRPELRKHCSLKGSKDMKFLNFRVLL